MQSRLAIEPLTVQMIMKMRMSLVKLFKNYMLKVWSRGIQVLFILHFGLRGLRRTYHTILKLADHAPSKIVRFVLL
jgi:hypothetical protein